MISVPFVSLYDQMDRAFSTLQIEGFKTVDHEDTEFNNDFSVDPLADPRLDKLDLFNMVDSDKRDELMNASSSFAVSDGDFSVQDTGHDASNSDAGSGE